VFHQEECAAAVVPLESLLLGLEIQARNLQWRALVELKAESKLPEIRAKECTYAYSFSLSFKTTKSTQGKHLNHVPKLRFTQEIDGLRPEERKRARMLATPLGKRGRGTRVVAELG
jgi:hypothetical protein